MRAGSSSSLVIPGKRFYGNLSHCVLMEKLHARDSSVNIFILKKFYRTEERKSHCCSLIHVFPSRNIPVISFKAFRKRSECHHSKHVPSGRRPPGPTFAQVEQVMPGPIPAAWHVLTAQVCALPFQPAAFPDSQSQHLALKCPFKTDRKHRSYSAPSENLWNLSFSH